MTSGPGIEPRPHWWEASALTTAPPLLPNTHQGENQQQTQPTYDVGSGNRTQATLVDVVRDEICPGARFSKVPKRFRAWKATAKILNLKFTELFFSHNFNTNNTLLRKV